jgi:hypothetical protein
LAPFVRQFAQVDRAWFNALAFTAVNAWLTAFEGSEAYEQCMHKYKVWHADHKPVAYPSFETSTSVGEANTSSQVLVR